MLKRYFRFGAAIAVGAAVTFGLLFVMQYMIASGKNGLNDGKSARIVDFVRVERDDKIEVKKPKPDKPPEPEKQPDMPNPEISNTDTSVRIAMVAPPVTMNTGIAGGIGFGVSDGEYLPIFKAQPIYPARALSQGLEGYVIVQYTVTTDGTTKDVVPIESTSKLFERAAVESALKYKYKPRIIDGVPVEVQGVTTKIVFQIED